MSNERFSDEVLSAIIDDEADAELVASVRGDSDASARLAQLRHVVQIVGEDPAPATAERRSASIAAALAAASPAPEVTSLAAARHEKAEATKKRGLSTGWIAAVAAAVAFVIAIPIAIGFGAESSMDTATEATDAAADVSDSASSASNASDDSGDVRMGAGEVDDAVDAMDASVEEDTMEEESAEESAEETVEEEVTSGADEAASDQAEEELATTEDVAESPVDAPTADELLDPDNLTVFNTIDSLFGFVDVGAVTPRYTADQMEAATVSAQCLQPDASITNEAPYALVSLAEFAGKDRLILVEFADDGTTRVLDAEDCSSLR